MTTKITIIGAGPGGHAAAIRASNLGAEVTVIEKDNVGGTCLNRGCIPSKVMKRSAELLEHFNRAKEFGISVNGCVSADMKKILLRKQEIINSQAQGILTQFKQNKITYLNGNGHIKGPKQVSVLPGNGPSQDVSHDRLIISTGSKPLELPGYPFDGNHIISSTDALNLKHIPKSMAIIGGGVIGCEFAFIFASLGSQVTVVEALPRLLPLPSVDEDCSKILQREMKKKKINFLVNSTVKQIDKKNGSMVISVTPSFLEKTPPSKKAASVTIEVEKVLVCIGRKADISGLGFEKTGIKTDEKGWIIADRQMKTNVPDIYAIGDSLGPARIMLAHAASTEGICAAENAMGINSSMNYDIVPSAVFTIPEIANVGLTEIQAKEQGHNAKSDSVLFRTLGKAHVIGEIAGQAKIISDKQNRKILGIHIIGPHATDLIAEGVLALQTQCTVKDLAETIHAHPTLSEIMLEVAIKAAG